MYTHGVYDEDNDVMCVHTWGVDVYGDVYGLW